LLKDLRVRLRHCFQFLSRAKGSAGEVRAQLYIAKDQDYLNEEQFNSALSLAEITSKQLTRFIQYLQTQSNARRVREDGAIYDVELETFRP
jgi:hypothetical protein